MSDFKWFLAWSLLAILAGLGEELLGHFLVYLFGLN